MLDVSIIIVNYNGGSLLADCLTSVFDHTAGLKYEVSVFDNASTDGSCDGLEERFLQLKVIKSAVNIGYAPANNRAIEASEAARYFLLLNPDTLLQSNAIRTVTEFMDTNQKVGICGPKIVLSDGKLDAPCRRSFKTPAIYLYHTLGLSKLFPKSERFGKYYLSYKDENESYEVDAVIGAFLAIREEVVKRIGLLDENFYIYGEDEDWCFRVKQAGWKVFYYPRATVIHQKGASTSKRRVPAILSWHKAAYLFHRKHLARSYGRLTNWLVYMGIAFHLGMTLFFNVLNLGRKYS